MSIIVYENDANYCIGRDEDNNVVLMPVGGNGEEIQWVRQASGENQGWIGTANNSQNVLAPNGPLADGTPLGVMNKGEGNQYEWNWGQQFISNLENPNFVIDNTDARTSNGNQIQLYTNGHNTETQYWSWQSYPLISVNMDQEGLISFDGVPGNLQNEYFQLQIGITQGSLKITFSNGWFMMFDDEGWNSNISGTFLPAGSLWQFFVGPNQTQTMIGTLSLEYVTDEGEVGNQATLDIQLAPPGQPPDKK
jgi:hypothetical protein